MHEFLPIASGLLLGGLLAATRLPRLLITAIVVILAAAATLGSGEFRLSWGYLIPDIAEVVSAAAIAYCALAWSRHRSSGRN